jgi:hypothetical protein
MTPRLLLLTLPALAVAAPLLVASVRRLVGLVRGAVVLRVPALPEQEVSLPDAGPFLLAVEGPAGGWGRALDLGLAELPGGRAVPASRVLVRAGAAGFGRARVAVRRCRPARPGAHLLRVDGAGPDAALAVVVARPHGLGLALHLAAVVALAGVVATSTLLTLLVAMVAAA